MSKVPPFVRTSSRFHDLLSTPSKAILMVKAIIPNNHRARQLSHIYVQKSGLPETSLTAIVYDSHRNSSINVITLEPARKESRNTDNRLRTIGQFEPRISSHLPSGRFLCSFRQRVILHITMQPVYPLSHEGGGRLVINNFIDCLDNTLHPRL